ncbi:uncharacterized protein LOC142348607 [Convolutriloba macropyga]|uniref:uncharacterized protein LOC142348607 n=1 Tax=Convolutriloba macropyga TaxID=536237 RepID=UPI003F51C262
MSGFGGSVGWPSCYPPVVTSQWLSVDAPESEADAVKALEDAYKAKMDAIAKFNCNVIPIGKTEADSAGGGVGTGAEDEGAVGTDLGGSGGNDSEDPAEEEAESSRGGEDDEQEEDEDEEMYESSDQGMESLDFDQ